MKLEHDFICRPGHWSIRGELRDDERTYVLRGEATVVRKRSDWRCTTLVATDAQASSRPAIVCVIQPCPQGSHWTSWRSDTEVGALVGRFVQNGSTCLSLWESVDAGYTGSDWLGPVNGGRFISHGALLRGGVPRWRWELELTRGLTVTDAPPAPRA